MRIKFLCLVVAFMAAHASGSDLPSAGTETPPQAQARQFGIFFGGTASQYDLCVRKGFLSKGDRPAEEVAKAFLDKATATQGAGLAAYMQDGWDTMKRESSEHEEFFTKEKCASVGKEWAKLQVKMRK